MTKKKKRQVKFVCDNDENPLVANIDIDDKFSQTEFARMCNSNEGRGSKSVFSLSIDALNKVSLLNNKFREGILVFNKYGKKPVKVLGFLDQGSQVSLFSDILADKLGIRIEDCDLPQISLKGIGGYISCPGVTLLIRYRNLEKPWPLYLTKGLKQIVGSHFLIGMDIQRAYADRDGDGKGTITMEFDTSSKNIDFLD